MTNETCPHFSRQALTFLRSLSTDTDSKAWITALRSGLLQLLEEVDYIVATVRTTVDLINPTDDRATEEVVLRDSYAPNSARGKASVTHSKADRRTWWQQLMQEAKKNNFPLDKYQSPVGFDYFHKGKAYTGSVIFFREKGEPPISETTLNLIRELHPFIEFLMSDHIARVRASHPTDEAFQALCNRISIEATLTAREVEVLILLVHGLTYADIAETLNVSIDTVRTHIVHIYRKTGCSNIKDLYAKYMSPRRATNYNQ